MKLICSFLTLLITSFIYGQDPIKIDLQFSGTTDKHQLVAHGDSSTLPDTMVISGKIMESYKGICGDLCAGGTLKIELSEKIEGYPHWYVYAITTCYEGEIAKDDIVSITVSKYIGDEEDCHYKKVIEIIDSKGVPYYKLSSEESQKIAH